MYPFIAISFVVLLFAAVAKIAGVLKGVPVLNLSDPVIPSLTTRDTMILAAALELICALLSEHLAKVEKRRQISGNLG